MLWKRNAISQGDRKGSRDRGCCCAVVSNVTWTLPRLVWPESKISSELIEWFLLGFVDGKRLAQKNSKHILIFSVGMCRQF